jgi:hypothetical protein
LPLRVWRANALRHEHPARAHTEALDGGAQSATVCSWTLRSEDFTERGFPAFTEAALALLVAHLQYTSEPAGGLAFAVPAALSDRSLAAALRVLEAAAAAGGAVNPAGRVAVTEAPRTNRDGALDEPEKAICPLCVLL